MSSGLDLVPGGLLFSRNNGKYTYESSNSASTCSETIEFGVFRIIRVKYNKFRAKQEIYL